LLLPRNGLVHAFTPFVEDQPIATVSARKPGRQALAVLGDSLR
jgi:hypothetical protein